MDNLQRIFISEAEEQISVLERALLHYEEDPGNKSSIEEIFRAMHTLKGSSSMFGFDVIGALTHDLETIYDEIRQGFLMPSSKILEVTLMAVDHLKAVIQDPLLELPENKARHDKILNLIKKNGFIFTEEDHQGVPQHAKDAEAPKFITYYVFVKPHRNILKNGTNLLYLIDDLCSLGKSKVLPRFDKDLNLQSFEGDSCYTSFEVILSTAAGETAINEVFIFAADLCEVTIRQLASHDLLESPDFLKNISDYGYFNAPYGFDILKAMAGASASVAESFSYEAYGKNQDQSGTSSLSKNTQANSIRVSSDKLDELMNLVSELVTAQARLSLIASTHESNGLGSLSEDMEKITRRLRENAFKICLVPMETLVTRFQRLIRDLTRELNKDVEFITEGTETELDKSIIENITDPILHLLRNCLDHGIELPEERKQKGKSPKGKITLKSYYSGTNVYIQIKDDGRGLDPEKIKMHALRKGVISDDHVFTEQEILELIFHPGFSTAEKVTDLSGRGVGMDIVKKNIEAVHGDVIIESVINEGVTFTIRLPLTLSIMDGLLVRIGITDYIVPLTAIDKCYELPSNKLKNEDIQKLVFDGQQLPVLHMRKIYSIKEEPVFTQVIKLNHKDFSIGISVDAIIGEYQAVIKPLGDYYKRQEEFSGAAILGDGSVALVFDTDRLIKKISHSEVQKIQLKQ